MRTLDPDMATLVAAALRRHGVDVRLGARARRRSSRERSCTDQGAIAADLVVLGIGVQPNSSLAEGRRARRRSARRREREPQAGRPRSSGVWAAGDCCESTHLVSGRKVHIASRDDRQQAVACRRDQHRRWVLDVQGRRRHRDHTICDTEVARTGLSEAEATEAGFAFTSTVIEGSTRAGYLPGKKNTTVKLVTEQRTGRLLGGQIVGEEGAAKRIDVLATAVDRTHERRGDDRPRSRLRAALLAHLGPGARRCPRGEPHVRRR